MFGLGMGELLVIMAIALIFLGPKRLPDVATSLGKAIRSFRKATRELSSQLEIDEEVKAPLRELQSALRDEPPPVRPLVMTTPPPETKPAAPAVPVAEAPPAVAAKAPSAEAPVAVAPEAVPDKKA
jgi:Tat protein translocase TatB subunit